MELTIHGIVYLALCLLIGVMAEHLNRNKITFFSLSMILTPIIMAFVLLFIGQRSPIKIGYEDK